MNNSRRKLAQALHNLGDEIQPRSRASPFREDISMTEETGEAAEERRRMAREEILRRSTVFEARRRKKQETPAPNSFDALVDENGSLHPDLLDTASGQVAKSTGVDLLGLQSGMSQVQNSVPSDVTNQDRLHIDIPSPTSPTNRSQTLLDLTPTSETADSAVDFATHEQPQETDQTSHPSDWDTVGSSSPVLSHASPAPSTAGSVSHIYETIDNVSTDGTISDLGRSTPGIPTPTSWSEVGSMISSDDGHGF